LKAAVARLPAWMDSENRPGTLEEMLAARPIRWVQPGTQGRSRGDRVWQLSVEDQGWLKPLGLVSGVGKLAEDERLFQRQGLPKVAEEVPAGAVKVESHGVRGAVWLGAYGTKVKFCSDLRPVSEQDFGVPGLSGWLDGFSLTEERVKLSEGQNRALQEAIATLLANEMDTGPFSFVNRLKSAMDSDERLPAAWKQVNVLTDVEGQPVSALELAKHLQKQPRDRVLKVASAWAGRPPPGLTVLQTPENQAFLRAVCEILQVTLEPAEPPSQRRAREAADRQKERFRKALVDSVVQLASLPRTKVEQSMEEEPWVSWVKRANSEALPVMAYGLACQLRSPDAETEMGWLVKLVDRLSAQAAPDRPTTGG